MIWPFSMWCRLFIPCWDPQALPSPCARLDWFLFCSQPSLATRRRVTFAAWREEFPLPWQRLIHRLALDLVGEPAILAFGTLHLWLEIIFVRHCFLPRLDKAVQHAVYPVNKPVLPQPRRYNAPEIPRPYAGKPRVPHDKDTVV